jgi:predicted DNA repair protein MutK
VFKGLLALVDDVSMMARATASSLDDVAALTMKAGSKAAGIVVDDAAVTPGYVVGLSADRELPVIWKICVGSLRNKLLILLPAALALSYFASWAIMPLLICGGLFLCFEGAEKVMEKLWPRAVGADGDAEAGSREAVDPVALEKARVRGAITTDFILSAEIMAITLTTVAEETTSFVMQAAVLTSVALAITVVVYGSVALIVKADEAGLWLARTGRGFKRTLGRAIVRGVPRLMTMLGIVGTAAMLWVGGDIVIHGAAELGASAPEQAIYGVAASAADAVPALADFVKWLVKAAIAGVVGLVAGGLVVLAKKALASFVSRVRARRATSSP